MEQMTLEGLSHDDSDCERARTDTAAHQATTKNLPMARRIITESVDLQPRIDCRHRTTTLPQISRTNPVFIGNLARRYGTHP